MRQVGKKSVTKQVVLSEEQLFEQGKIKQLFDIVIGRKLSRWNPTTKVRESKKREVADLNNFTDDQSNILETWALGKYTDGDFTAYVVRVSGGTDEGVYAVEIFNKTTSVDSFWNDDLQSLLREIKKFIEPSRKPGRPKKEEATSEMM